MAFSFSSRLQTAFLIIFLRFIWTQTNGQYETPNNLCGGYFRYVKGNINFTFNPATTNVTDTEKLCMWTVAPARQYIKFIVDAMNFPNIPCDSYSVTINALEDREQKLNSSNRYCRGSEPVLPLTVHGSIMVIVLKVKSVQDIIGTQGTGFFMSYDKEKEEDYTNATQLVNTFYSFGRPSVDPIPYFAAGFMNNGMSTFGFIKANYSTGTNYEFQLSYDSIKLDHCLRGEDDPKDFLMMFDISSTGALVQPIVYHENRTSTEIYKSGYGFFIIFWGGRNCSIGAGGSMQLYYDSVRVS